MKFPALIVALCIALSLPCRTQMVSADIAPNPAPPGTTVTLTITAYGLAVALPNFCAFQSVRAGSPTGPVVFTPSCPPIFLPLNICNSWNTPFVPPPNLPPGDYWFEVQYLPIPFTTTSTEFFCFSYLGSGAPTLTNLTTARIGTDLIMSINAPGYAGSAYITAASLTTNTGFPISGSLYVCLDIDPIFLLSVPVPDPLLFANFQGTLDATGSVSGITVHIPNLPGLVCLPLHVQAALTGGGLAPPALTNPLSFTIIP